jgi:hypothetical protein
MLTFVQSRTTEASASPAPTFELMPSTLRRIVDQVLPVDRSLILEDTTLLFGKTNVGLADHYLRQDFGLVFKSHNNH